MGNDNSIHGLTRCTVGALALALCACGSMKKEAPVEWEPVAMPAEAATESTPAFEAEPGPGDGVAVKSSAPLRYVVQKGDTLWAIANRFLKDAWQWPEVWYINDQVRNPHLIYPGDELLLLYVDGAPVVARADDEPFVTGEGPVAAPDTTDRLSPAVRELALDQAVYTIPLEAIRAFLRGPRFVGEDELDDAPYVAAFEDDQLLAGANDIAYVMDLDEQPAPRYSQYQIVRRGREYRDPDDNDVIGYEALPVADSEVRVIGDPSTVFLTRSDIETRAGDYLLPLEQDPFALRFMPRAPDHAIDGQIISVYNGLSQIGQFQIVTLNRGASHGLEPGHVLGVFEAGRTVTDPRSWYGRRVELPDIRSGTVMVFKTSERASYALVVDARRPIHILDKVEKPAPSLP